MVGEPASNVAPEQERGRGRRVADVALAVIAISSPAEVPYFDELCAAFFANPGRVLHPARRRRSQPTEGGIPGASDLVTGIVIATVAGLADDAAKVLITSASARAQARLKRRNAVKKLRVMKDSILSAEVPPLEADEAWREAERARHLAIEAGLSQDDADRLSKEVFSALSHDGGADRRGELDGDPPPAA